MKKQLLTLLALAAFTAAFAEHVAPVQTMVIPQATCAITIDADDAEDCWSAEQPTTIFNASGLTAGDEDFKFTFKVAYDLQYLYVFGRIQDDVENNWEWGGSNQWTFDNVELFIDLDTNGTVAAYDSNAYQLRWNRGLDSVGNDYGRSGQVNRWDHKYAWENTANGWVFESALAWKFVLGAGQKTEDILQYCDGVLISGFDMSGADSDGEGPDLRDVQSAWDSDGDPTDAADRTEDNAWNNRLVFGLVTFQKYVSPINDFGQVNSAVAYPNPTTGIVNFEGVEGTVEIMNLAGQVVMSTEIVDGKIDMSSLSSGVYVAKAGKDAVRIIKQ